MPSFAEDRETIRQLIHDLNECWYTGRPDAIAEFLHDDAVIVPPGFQMKVQGKEAFVADYKQFVEHAKLRDFLERDADVAVWGGHRRRDVFVGNKL